MADILEIWGGRPLCGTVQVPSAKNSVLPLLAATVLCQGKVCLRRVPDLSDVEAALDLLRAVGLSVRRCGDTVQMRPAEHPGAVLPTELMQKMRASVLLLAPVLCRCGSVEASLPGGCKLGARPIDMHLDGLVQLGAELHWRQERLCLHAPRGLTGTTYTLRSPSVGATETMLLAGVCAKGTTRVRNAAREPEVQDLARFLNACGGRISGIGTAELEIQGVAALHGCSYTPVPDRIYAATIACACAAAGGQVRVQGIRTELLEPVLRLLETAGCQIRWEADGFVIRRSGVLHGVGRVETGVYPGLPTDAAPLLAAALLRADGPSCLCDRIFPRRFACAEGFARMGAKVQVEGAALHIAPGGLLHGSSVQAQDLRGGAALAIAALAAAGKTEISDSFYLKRGYSDIKADFRTLGAKALMKK